MDRKKHYTTGEAAKLCDVSQQTIIRCFDAGLLGGFKVPGSKFRRIGRLSLLAFALEHGIPIDEFGELDETERAMVAAKRGPAAAGEVIGPVKVNRVGDLLRAG